MLAFNLKSRSKGSWTNFIGKFSQGNRGMALTYRMTIIGRWDNKADALPYAAKVAVVLYRRQGEGTVGAILMREPNPTHGAAWLQYSKWYRYRGRRPG